MAALDGFQVSALYALCNLISFYAELLRRPGHKFLRKDIGFAALKLYSRIVVVRMDRYRYVRKKRPGRSRPDQKIRLLPVRDLELHEDRRRGLLLIFHLCL